MNALGLLLPILVLFVYNPGPNAPAVAPWVAFATYLGISALQLVLARYGMAWLLRDLRRRPEMAVELSTRANRLGMVLFSITGVSFFVCVYLLDLPYFFYLTLGIHPRFVVGDLMLLAIPYAVMMGNRWFSYQLQVELRGATIKRDTFMGLGYRRLLVFALPQVMYYALVRALFYNWKALPAFVENHPTMFLLMMGSYIYLFFLMSPFMVRFLFPRRELTADMKDPREVSVFQRLRRLAHRGGQLPGRIFIWDTVGLPFANAVVTGMLSHYRHFYLSDYLLDQLSDDEIEAVFAHEMGHVHFRHLLYNYLLSISLTLFLIWGVWVFSPVIETHMMASITVMALVLFYMFFVLRRFLNRFEKQADLFAVHLLGDAHTFHTTLTRLAGLNLANTGRRSITHPSIDERREFLASLNSDAVVDKQMGTELRYNRRSLLLFAIGLAATIALLELTGFS